MTTVARPLPGWRWFDVELMLVALGVSVSMLSVGAGAIAKGGMGSWMAVPAVIFTTIGALGTAGDFRGLRSGPPTGGPRLARHLWRMSAALAIGSLSFSVRAATAPSRAAAASCRLRAADTHGPRDDGLLDVARTLETTAPRHRRHRASDRLGRRRTLLGPE